MRDFETRDVPGGCASPVKKAREKVAAEREWKTKDSGHRRQFESGAQRDRAAGKGKYHLISPLAMKRLAGVYERGADKYGERNYELGIPLGDYLDSALRHLFQVLEGKADEDHAAQALWNIASFIHTEEMIKRGLLPDNLDNLPSYAPSYTHNEDSDWKQKNRSCCNKKQED